MVTERMTSREFRERYGKQGRVRSNFKETKRDYKSDFLLQLKLAGLPKPKSEVKFHATRKWRFDWAYKSQRIAIEYQGGIYATEKSGHSTTKGLENDFQKITEASLLGWTVILITAKTVENGKALQFVWRALKGE